MKLFANILAIVLILGSNALAQSAKPLPFAQLAAYNKPDREQMLFAGAKTEGKATWYTSLAGGSYKELAAAFEAKYPGVKVESYRGTSEELLAKLTAESQAKRFIADTVESTLPLLRYLKDNKLLTAYASNYLAKYPDAIKENAQKGLVYWAIDRESHIGLSYNKNSIPQSLVPKNYDGLLKPELKDKIGIAGSDTGIRVLAAMSKFRGDDYFKKLKAQNPVVHNVSGRALLDMVISGEIGLSPTTFRNHAETSIKAGAPIAWVPMEIVPTNSGATAVSVQPPHPNAALLLADFILGPEGQRVLEKFDYGNPTKDYGFKRWFPEQGLSLEQYEQLDTKMTKVLRELSRKSF
ncbi:MAG: ABC transporter substrate-binding protein [Alphaproteobacteria bacterium]